MPTTDSQPTDPRDTDTGSHAETQDAPDVDDSVTGPPAPAADDLREKFRAALDRKQGKGAGSATDTATGAGGSKASARTSNTKHQREFRRKSGG